MYGLINKAIRDLIIEEHGSDSWVHIVKNAGYELFQFLPMEVYPDEMTFKLVQSASQYLKVPQEELLRQFGRFWIQFTAIEGYGEILYLFGADFISCLKNLNAMHARIGALMPNLTPPKFQLIEIETDLYNLHYQSSRRGLAPMIVGLLEGLAERHNTEIKIEKISLRTENQPYDEFRLRVLRGQK